MWLVWKRIEEEDEIERYCNKELRLLEEDSSGLFKSSSLSLTNLYLTMLSKFDLVIHPYCYQLCLFGFFWQDKVFFVRIWFYLIFSLLM